MKKTRYYILAMVAMLAVSCTPDEPRDGNIEWAVRAVWQNGQSNGKAKAPTRSGMTMATDILAEGNGDIEIDYSDYPATIDITCKTPEPESKEIKTFSLTKGSGICGEHPDYWDYTADFLFRDQLIRRENYVFYAKAVIDEDGDPATTADGDRLEGTANKTNIDGKHMLLTLHHTKALLRFGFKVSEKYDKVRYIRVTEIEVNGEDCALVDKVLNKSSFQPVSYLYLEPTKVLSDVNTIVCTYNIYDKDAVFPTPGMTAAEKATAEEELRKHLDREGVKAQNTFKLNGLKKADGVTSIDKLEAGKYYDLRVTLNPDYLYVLSDHDNKQIEIE